MQGLVVAALVLGVLAGLASFAVGFWLARRTLLHAKERARRLLTDARRDAENRERELVVAAHERALAQQEEADRREREQDERESVLEARAQELQRGTADVDRRRQRLERSEADLERRSHSVEAAERTAAEATAAAQGNLERIAGLTAAQARAELIAGIEEQARQEAALIARRIEEEARDGAEREAVNLIVQAAQRVDLREALESTVSFIELANDEMKGRIIGKEGRNIRALEMATGIDLIVDDTPRSIWISCFDPLRREIARVSIDRLLKDGRIHPARIEETVQRVTEEIDAVIQEKGEEAAFSLGITDLNLRLVRLVGRLRYHTSHGQNLLQHSLETAILAGHMTEQLGGDTVLAQRAGLLHEVGQASDETVGHAVLGSPDLCARYQERPEVVDAIRSLQPDVQPRALEAILLGVANRVSESRPGARKENLAVFIERLRRLEAIAERFPGVRKAYAVKAGRDLRVIVDVERTTDDSVFLLSKDIARAVERELTYSGQIKVSVVRETRAVRFAV